MSKQVDQVIATYPAKAQTRIRQVRDLIFDVAAAIPGIGELEETLKWGEPSYLTPKSKSGTTLRVAWKEADPAHYSLFVNCQTSLIDQYRSLFPELEYIGNREVRLPISRKPPACIRECIALALTYKKPQLLGLQKRAVS